VTLHRLIAPLTVATILAIAGGGALAQDIFPAPLPGQAAWPMSGRSPTANVGTPPTIPFPFNGAPPIAGGGVAAAPSSQAEASDECMKEFLPLRTKAEKRGQLIRNASGAHAPPDESCKLIGNYRQAELKMIRYFESHATTCGIPTQVADQLKNGHRNTEAMLKKVCALAQQMQNHEPAGPTGDFDQPIMR